MGNSGSNIPTEDGCEMATAEQVKALLKSYSNGDSEHFVSVALQIAAHSARTGKGQLARSCGILLMKSSRSKWPGRSVGQSPSPAQKGSLPVCFLPPTQRLAFPKWYSQPGRFGNLIVSSVNIGNRTGFANMHCPHRRKLLLIGPPGCGKTMTASALAGELKLPLFSVQLHGLITKFMGETAAKLYLIFDAMRQTRGVYLFDEFDAIGADRGTENDVGEIRRVLNSFLQFLEQDDSDSITLAATNYEAMLDEALFRRFDDVVPYVRPSPEQVESLIKNRLHKFMVKRPDWLPDS